MGYKDLKKDLPKRTIDILENYEGEYELTLLINCLTALLILPYERFFKPRPEVNIDIGNLPDWGLTRAQIKEMPYNLCGYNLREIVKHMRHAVAHMRIDVASNDEHQIDKLIFADKRGQIWLEIPVEDLRTFVFKLAQSVVEKDLVGTAHPTN
jgi:hypothetical protein